MHAFAQSQAGQQFTSAQFAGFIQLVIQAQHQFHVFNRTQVRYQVICLEGEADLLPAHCHSLFIAHTGQVLAIQQDLPGGGLQQGSQDGKHGGLAGPAGADQGNEFSCRNVQ